MLKSLSEASVVDVQATLTELRSYYANRDKMVKKSVELYNRSVSLKTPDGIIPVVTHAATTICERGADRLGSGRLQVHMEPRRDGEKEIERIESMEKAGAAVFYQARKRAKYNPIRAWGLHAFQRGAMVGKFQLDLEAQQEQPKRSDFKTDIAFEKAKKLWQYRQLERFPMLIDARPIECLYPDPETDGDNFVIEHYKRKVGDIKKNFPNWEAWSSENAFNRDAQGKFKSKQYRDDTSVEYIEVWTREWRGVIVDGQWCPIGDFPAGPVPNLYGRPPYFMRYPFGDPTGKPEERCVSILRAVEDELMMESRMMTVVQAVAEAGAYGATVVSSKDTSALATIAFGPGAVIESDMPVNERPSPLQQTNRLADALQALQVASAAAAEGAVPSEARGAPSPGRSGAPSGVAAAILTGQASMVIDPVKSAMEDLISDMIPFVFYVLDTVWEGKLSLYGQVGKDQFVNIDLDSETIDGHYGPVYVTLKLQAPEENHASWNLGIQAMQTGKFPDSWVMETFFAVENADAMLEDAHASRLAGSEEVDAYLKARLIERLQAKSENVADAMPGSKVPAPAGAPMGGMGGDPAMVANGGIVGPPMDPMMRASLGIAPGPQVPGGAPSMTAPTL